VTDGAKQLFRADAAGLMLIDAEGQLRWASASDQTAQTVENEQERLAQGPCAVAFSQRLPAAIRNIHTEPDWDKFAQVLVGEGVCAALSVPVELDGGVIGTLDIYAREPRTGIPAKSRPCRPMPGWWPACSRRRSLPRSRGALPTSCRPPWSTAG
jgi:GAF domain-containing protein